MKERAEASSGSSHEGSAVSGAAGEGDAGDSGCLVEGRAASFLFFEEDVLTGLSCSRGGSSGREARLRQDDR